MNNEKLISYHKTKDAYWQYVRGICIICVVLIHCKSGISYENGLVNKWNFDYWFVMRQLINFPVAIFIILSGYFTNIEANAKFNFSYIIKQRGGRLLIPFLVWSTFYTLIKVIIAEDYVNIVKSIAKLLLGLSQAHLYFILVLLQLTIITPILINAIRTNRGTKLLLFITPIYLMGLYSYAAVFKEQFLFYQTLFPAWFIFYYVGLLIKIKGYKPIFNKSQLMKSILLCVIVVLFSIIEGYGLLSLGFSVGFASSQIKISSYVYVFTVINLLMVIKPYIEKHKIKLLELLGDKSYGIYYVHMFWIVVSNMMLSHIAIIEEALPFYQLIQVVIVVVFSCISILCTKKIVGKQLSSKLLGF